MNLFQKLPFHFSATAKSLQSCPTLRSPIDGSPLSSPIPGILQPRTLEWVAISFSNSWKWKVKVKSLSRVWLLATPWTAAHQAPPFMGFSRQEYWSRLPLPSPKVKHNLDLIALIINNRRNRIKILTGSDPHKIVISSVQLHSGVRLFATPWNAARKAAKPGVHSDSCPSSQWCYPAISSSVVPFSSCPQSLPASESFNCLTEI